LAKEALKGSPDQLEAYLLLVVSYSLLNHIKEAREAAEEVLRIDPDFSIKRLSKMLPFKHQETVDIIIDALRQGGLPD